MIFDLTSLIQLYWDMKNARLVNIPNPKRITPKQQQTISSYLEKTYKLDNKKSRYIK